MKLINVFKWCKLNESMSVKDWKNNFVPSKMADWVREKVKNALDWYRLPENEDIRKDYPLESFPSVNNLIYSIEWLKNKKAYLNANRDESNYDTVFENEKFVIICPLNPNAAHKTAHYLFDEDGPEEYESDAGNELVDYKHNRGWGGNLSPTWCIAASGMAQKYWKDYHLYDNHLTYFIFFKEKRYHGLRYALVLDTYDFDSFLNGYDISEGHVILEFRDPKQHRGHGGRINYLEDYHAFLDEAGMDDEDFSEIIREYAKENNFSLKGAERPEHQFNNDYWHDNVEDLFKDPTDEETLREMCIDMDFYEREVYKMRDEIVSTELPDNEDEDEDNEDEDDLGWNIEEEYPDLTNTMDNILDDFVDYDPQEEYYTLIDKTIDLILKNKNKNIITGGYYFLNSLINNRYRGTYVIENDEVEKYSQLFKKIATTVKQNALLSLFKQDDENTKVISNVYYFYLFKSSLFEEGVSNYVLKSAINNISSQKLLERILSIVIKSNLDKERNISILHTLLGKSGNNMIDFLEEVRKENHQMWQDFVTYHSKKYGNPKFFVYLINVYESGDTDIFDDEEIQKRFIKYILPEKELYKNEDKAMWGFYFVKNLISGSTSNSFNKEINPNEGIKCALMEFDEKSRYFPILKYFESNPLPNTPTTWKEATNHVKYTDELLYAISITYTYMRSFNENIKDEIYSKIKESYPRLRNKIINYTLSHASKYLNKDLLIKDLDSQFGYES